MLEKRKHPRLKEYDYAKNGCYFVTICVKKRKQILSTITVGRDAHIPPNIILTNIGYITQKYINNINYIYDNIKIDKYVIMPDHIHMIINISNPILTNSGMWASRPTINIIVRSLKIRITKELGFSIWQDSFYEHIIRNQKDYNDIW